MKIFFTLFFLSLGLTVFGQTPEEKNKILKHTNIIKLNELRENLIEQHKINEKIIDDFVNQKGISRRKKDENGNLTEIKYILNNQPVYVTVDNVNAAISTRTNKLHNGGSLGLNLEGQNMYIALWDGGSALLTHQEFLNSDNTASRITKGETLLNTVSDHATHVAGTMVAKGTNADAKGMAPQATITSYDWTSDSAEVINEITNNALLLSNHSYGVPVTSSPAWVMGCYSSDARDWDQIHYDAPYYLMVASAGNSGEDTYSGGLAPGYDKLTYEKNSKNNLVIASAKPLVFPNGNILIQEDSFSSQGPSDDGRIKPDITANGNLSFSSYGTADDAYAQIGGTSMSAPNTSGTLLLLQQYYNQLHGQFMRAATLKGLVCHTATDDTFTVGPDPELGWGFLNAETSAQAILDDSNGDALILESSLTNGGSYSTTLTTDGASALSATICWTDPAGTARDNQLNDPTPALVNDLDLRLTAPDGTTVYFPWKLQLSDVSAPPITGDNIVDNVENIDINTPTPGTYTLDVTHKGILTNGSQDFSLILTGSNLTLSTGKNSISNYFVWPNPTKDILYFKFKSLNDSKVMVTLNDIRGRKVMRKVIVNPDYEINSYLNVNTVTKGVYILNIKQGNTIVNKKVVIE